VEAGDHAVGVVAVLGVDVLLDDLAAAGPKVTAAVRRFIMTRAPS
jgi:hypothetical protein